MTEYLWLNTQAIYHKLIKEINYFGLSNIEELWRKYIKLKKITPNLLLKPYSHTLIMSMFSSHYSYFSISFLLNLPQILKSISYTDCLFLPLSIFPLNPNIPANPPSIAM